MDVKQILFRFALQTRSYRHFSNRFNMINKSILFQIIPRISKLDLETTKRPLDDDMER